MGKIIKLSNKEVQFLKQNCKYFTQSEIARKMKRDYTCISSYKYKLNLKFKPYHNPISEKEIIFIQNNIGKISITKIADKLNKSHFFIWNYAKKLNLYSNLRADFKGKNNGMFKKNHTYYSKKKISKNKKLRWKNDIQFRKKSLKILDKLHKNQIGKKRSKETCIKIGLIHKNKIVSEITKKKLKNRDYKWLIGNKNPMYNPENLKKCLKSNFKRPTLPEKRVNQICKINNLTFEYVGNGKKSILRYVPDFIDENNKKIIEVFEDYWHTINNGIIKKDKIKIKSYKKLGYQPLIIWEKELKDPQKVTEKIINFYSS